MRIVCLVPSITETLLVCGVRLVGRSRYCIHPAEAVNPLPKVGGTKDVDWSRVAAVRPDLVILDREENTLEMAEGCPFPYIALHITAVTDVGPELYRLARRIDHPPLEAVAERWREVAQIPAATRTPVELPGVIEWWREPWGQEKVEYLIWRKPWMAIGKGTFIQSMLCHQGMAAWLQPHAEKYPVIDLQQLNPEQTILLFSSEPYPFQRFSQQMVELGFSCALLDGEMYSWYGIRSLLFLEHTLR